MISGMNAALSGFCQLTLSFVDSSLTRVTSTLGADATDGVSTNACSLCVAPEPMPLIAATVALYTVPYHRPFNVILYFPL